MSAINESDAERQQEEILRNCANYLAQGQSYLQNNEFEKAIAEFTKALDGGLASSQNSNLVSVVFFYRGMCYQSIRKLREAAADYTKAVDLGNEDAKKLLNDIAPKIAEEDAQKAAQAVRNAAERGDAEAQYKMGRAYDKGELGVYQDYSQAADWYFKAAAQGHAMACWQLGYAYEEGYGVYKNLPKAVKWYRKDAKLSYKSKELKKIELKLGIRGGIIGAVIGVGIGFFFINGYIGLIASAAIGLLAGFFIGRKIVRTFPALLAIAVAIFAVGFAVYKFAPSLIKDASFDKFSVTALTAKFFTQTVTVTSDALNLRAQASGSADIVKTLKKGDKLTVTGKAENGWLPVRHDGSSGWVSGEYVK